MITKGQKINDRYQIIRSVGEGGMANVYLAHDLILDRDVAVKILRGDLANDEKFVRRFQREAIAASSLTHPNIVEMYDVGEDDGKYFIVMEFVEGRTLKSLIKRRGALSLAETIDIMLQLTSGLACAHESYIIHRDIKPQNVLILDDGTVKITDFGIAVALNSNELTQTNSVMGSVHYLPPEQANGTGSTIKSDIYSLGILMYELLTGKLPFKGENAVEIAIKQMKDPIPSLVLDNPEIPQSVENIVLKATAKNPKNRYDNVMEMNEDLKNALSPERADEQKLVYRFPEQEADDKNKITRLKKNEIKNNENKEEKKEKRTNKTLMITGIITTILVLATIFIFLILPSITKTPEVQIPDVSEMTVVKAEKELKNVGFEVATEVTEKHSDEIEEGNVIGTSPSIGRTVKKGTKIKLIVSKGMDGFEAENYVGQNYITVKANLEAKGVNVIIEEEEHTEEDNIEKDKVLKQDVDEGEKLVSGDTITLTVSKIITIYPDFVSEDWAIADIQKFCDENGITLQTITKETNAYNDGSIISQSRTAGSKVMSGVTLKITVAKKLQTETSTTPNSSTDTSTSISITTNVPDTINTTTDLGE